MIFHDLIIAQVVTVYMDDILVFTKTMEEHRQVTTRVMQILLDNDLFLKPTKCYFEVDTVEYLGFIISADHISMDPVKIDGISAWPTPKNLKEVQSFLGFGNFYRRFIQDFATLAQPLNDLTKKNTPFEWTNACHNAFTLLKRSFTTSPVLIYPDHRYPFRLETDASDFILGAILSQEVPGNGWHPIAYLSKSFNAAERNYDIFDKELLAVIHALDHWRVYLEGAQWPFEIWSDHKNLLYFSTSQMLSHRQARWSLFLSRFNFTLIHKPGVTHHPDALSRHPDLKQGVKTDNTNQTLLNPQLFVKSATGRGTIKMLDRQLRQ